MIAPAKFRPFIRESAAHPRPVFHRSLKRASEPNAFFDKARRLFANSPKWENLYESPTPRHGLGADGQIRSEPVHSGPKHTLCTLQFRWREERKELQTHIQLLITCMVVFIKVDGIPRRIYQEKLLREMNEQIPEEITSRFEWQPTQPTEGIVTTALTFATAAAGAPTTDFQAPWMGLSLSDHADEHNTALFLETIRKLKEYYDKQLVSPPPDSGSWRVRLQ